MFSLSILSVGFNRDFFQPTSDSQKEDEKKESFKVGKLKKDIWNTETLEEKTEESETRESFKVGKLRRDAWNAADASSEQKVEPEQQTVKLRGARRINKGNRISCLIENLHGDKKPDSEDEDVNADSDPEDDVKLGDGDI